MPSNQDEHKALVRRLLGDVFADGDAEALSVLIADDVAVQDPVFRDGSGIDALRSFGRGVLSGTDVDVDIEELVAEGNIVAVRSTVSGNAAGLPIELDGTRRSFAIDHVWFCTIEDGRIVRLWSLPDGLGLLRQLETHTKTPQFGLGNGAMDD